MKRGLNGGSVKMGELIDILQKNCKSYDDLLNLMLTSPKYGNDDDYTDFIASELKVKTTA